MNAREGEGARERERERERETEREGEGEREREGEREKVTEKQERSLFPTVLLMEASARGFAGYTGYTLSLLQQDLQGQRCGQGNPSFAPKGMLAQTAIRGL